jgi:copper homeostasis protein
MATKSKVIRSRGGMNRIVEICVQGIESALASSEGGADRIELCEDLAVGGVTPSAGTMAVACRQLALPVHVLIRPRGGDFVYSKAEFDVIQHDVETAKALGAAGVVIGILQSDGTIDRRRLARLVEISRPLAVTFHRAFDDVANPLEALDALIDLGIERVLTSGGKVKAVDGLSRLAELSERSADRIAIMAGGRIIGPDIPALLGIGLKEIHIGSAVYSDGRVVSEKVSSMMGIARKCRG